MKLSARCDSYACRVEDPVGDALAILRLQEVDGRRRKLGVANI